MLGPEHFHAEMGRDSALRSINPDALTKDK